MKEQQFELGPRVVCGCALAVGREAALWAVTQQFVMVCTGGNGESLSVVAFQSLFLLCFARSCSLVVVNFARARTRSVYSTCSGGLRCQML